MDKHTPEQRHKNMQAIKNKDSKIEILLRKESWKRGIRYRKNVKGIINVALFPLLFIYLEVIYKISVNAILFSKRNYTIAG